MSSIGVSLDFDRLADVLYARRDGASVARGVPAREDDYLILNTDAVGEVVGVQLMAATEMPAAYWREHPDREELPQDILAALDGWITEHGLQ